ncbi:hypothetical protein LX36DRAFT_379606 [Colletotrichum falcatum]|nr:hypothetical protein LX36DRAFT_379606 [Colletotrichum falcatum]
MSKSSDTTARIKRDLLIIPQTHSRDSPSISPKGVDILLEGLSAFSGLQSVIDSFVPDDSDCYRDRSGAYFNDRSCTDLPSERLESCHLLKFVEMNHRKQPMTDDELGRLQNTALRWSVRQQGVYHLHEARDDKLRSFTVLINPSRHFRDLIKAEFGNASVEPEERIAWATMHILAFRSLPKNWASYISCLYQVVQKIRRDAAATKPHRPIIGDANAQSLQAAVWVMGNLQTAAHVLEMNIAVMRFVYQEVNARPALGRNYAYLSEKERLLDCVDSVTRELEFQRKHVLVITAKLDSITAMVRDLVNLRNTHTTETLTARTVIEAQTMKVIALLTLGFLPPTFVAGFLDMGYIDIKSEKGLIRLDFKPGLWLYLAVSLPLVIVIISAYLMWDRRNMRRTTRQESLV